MPPRPPPRYAGSRDPALCAARPLLSALPVPLPVVPVSRHSPRSEVSLRQGAREEGRIHRRRRVRGLPLHALDSPGRYRSVHEATKSPGRAEPNARNSNVQVDGLRIRVPPCSGGRLLGATGGWRSAAPGEGWRWDVLKRSAPSTRRTPAGSCTSGEPMWGSRMDKRGSAACAQRFGRDRKVGRRGVRDTTTCGPPAAKHTNSGVKSSYGAGAADPPPSSRGQRTGAQGEHGDERGVPWRAA
ncbi:hypothetical protein C2E23DRAFT_891253 [Lenzites betulinus]|nr:hypothetical protein C2E23DRAFT_891253 [Lenzites betulinus]